MNFFQRTDIAYKTDHNAISSVEKIMPTFWFYLRFLAIIFRASAEARQGRYDDSRFLLSSRNSLRALERVGVRFEISGLEHLNKLNTPCVVVANHMSMLETIILPMMILPYRQVTFIVKESLMHYPVFKHVLQSRRPIVVSRANARQDLKTVLQEGLQRLKQGISVVVFPQTTRTRLFDPQKFNTMGVKLAKRAQVPVLPLALLTDAWQNGKVIKEFGKINVSRTVRFAFGEPLWVNHRGADAHARIISFIDNSLTRWRRLDGSTDFVLAPC